MNLKDRLSAFENDAKLLERIAKYDTTPTEYAALKRAAISLWYVSTANHEALTDYVTKSEGD